MKSNIKNEKPPGMKIIGITGTLGAGKGTVVQYLVEQKGYHHYSVRAFLLEEIRRRGLPENRDSLTMVANEMRSVHSPSYVTDQLYFIARKKGQDCVIESIRTPGEIFSLRTKGDFILLSVDADPEIRFQRIIARNSETDRITYNTFLSNEAREMTSDDPNHQNLRACINLADFHLLNNGTPDQLFHQVENLLDPGGWLQLPNVNCQM
jgi:dephospho-CoA kinase